MRAPWLIVGSCLLGACAPEFTIEATNPPPATGGAGGAGSGGEAGAAGEAGTGGSAGEAGGGGGAPFCGNGAIDAGEACDDGNGSDADDCTARCELQRVLAISTGASHACAILHDGRVKCWGDNTFGQLGLGDDSDEDWGDEGHEMGVELPAVDLDGVAAVQVSCGVLHTCVLLADNAVRCWGNNGVAELGVEKSYAQLSEAHAPADPVDLGAGLTVDHISAGSGHTCARFTSGTAKCWGFNSSGQLGIDSTTTLGGAPGQMGDALPFVLADGASIEAIRAGNMHTCALLTGGLVRCWGFGSKGQLGVDAVDARGDEPGDMAALASIPLAGPATAIAGGGEASCALLAGGAVQCWGHNDQGQLGIGHRNDWGDETGEMATLPLVNLGGQAEQLVVGINHACARLAGGGVKCWGEGVAGGLGQGEPDDLGAAAGDLAAAAPIDFGTTAAPVEVAGRSFGFTCGLFEDGAVRCWGYNDHGQLGAENEDSVGDEPGEMGPALRRVHLFSDVW